MEDETDSSDPADSSDASDSSDPADNSDDTDSSDPADNSDASDSTEPTTPTELGCGNGIVEEGESCDDGNRVTEACDYGEISCLICNILCQEVPGETRYCGDDIIQIDFDEQCDDGLATETCSDNCIASEDYIPEPEEVAPKIEQSAVPTFLEKNKFLFDSSAPVQKDASPTIFDANRIGVMRGTVESADGQPLTSVRVSIAGHSEYGYTLTRSDGGYDLAVNGGKK